MTTWEFNKRTMTIALKDSDHAYEIDLERCDSSAEILNWIIQVSKKTWATDKIIGGLVRELDQVLDLQGNICSFGMDKAFDAEQWVLSNEGKKHRWVTGERLDKHLKKYMTNPLCYSIADLSKAYDDAIKEMPRDF